MVVFLEGAQVLSVGFLTRMWSHRDISQGGILPAIVGTLFLGIGVTLVSIPLGVGSAIYLQEYGKGHFARAVTLAIRNLAGVPSIVYGIFGLAFFVQLLRLGTTIAAAALTLGCMTLPWIIAAGQEALKTVPDSFREASYALGATRWQTVRGAVLPNAFGGMLTGSILGISRAMGETAPILMVGATFYMDYLPASPFDKFMALPYHLFILATQHASPLAKSYAMGTAMVLILLVFALNTGMFLLRAKLRRMKTW